MFEAMRRPSWRFLAALALALTTMLVGFAHRPLALEARGYGLDVADYVLPDGSLPALCHRDDVVDHRDDHGARVATVCEACLLTGAPGWGAVAEIVVPAPTGRALARSRIAETRAEGRATPTARARGPPLAA